MNHRTPLTTLAAGKLPPEQLMRLLAAIPRHDAQLMIGPGRGADCAVMDLGDELLVMTTDPVTLASDRHGELAVRINANDLATTGATPRWLLLTLLLPAEDGNLELAEQLMEQAIDSCEELGIQIVGGHSEVTTAVNRPIAVGALAGLVTPTRLVATQDARPGDRLLLTKSVAIEATALLAREHAARLRERDMDSDVEIARAYYRSPGIDITREARIACKAGRVSAMHDLTEGGLTAGLWNLAEACGARIRVEPERVPVTPLTARILGAFAIDPLSTLSSGSLLIAAAASEAERITEALAEAEIPCCDIGEVIAGEATIERRRGQVWEPMPAPARDGLTELLAHSPKPGAAH